jgi:peroxiredoxin
MEFEVTQLRPTDHVEAGDRAPEFTRPLVNDEFWEDVSLSEVAAARPVVLVFHTMDGDFPATYMWNELIDRAWDEAYDVEVVGLSISSPYEHSRFIEDRGMDYRLFSDPANGVAEQFGIVHDLDGMAGLSEPRISLFVVDTDLTVRYDWVSEEWPAFPDYDEVEETLADL